MIKGHSAGVRYLFLDYAYFGPGFRNDDSVLASLAAHLSIDYQDSRARIWRSDEGIRLMIEGRWRFLNCW
jgi:hypothetical protein